MIFDNKEYKTAAVIVAAGMGSRMGTDITKQRMKLLGHTVLWHTLRAFEDCDTVDSIVLVVRADERAAVLSDIGDEFGKISVITEGGKTRLDSVKCGIRALTHSTDVVAIHDGARCLVTPAMVDSVVRAAIEHGSASAVSVITDTVKKVNDKGKITDTLKRDGLCLAATPQVFFLSKYREALNSLEEGTEYTDDNMLLENIGEEIFAVDTGRENIKITYPEDLGYAEYVIRRRSDDAL